MDTTTTTIDTTAASGASSTIETLAACAELVAGMLDEHAAELGAARDELKTLIFYAYVAGDARADVDAALYAAFGADYKKSKEKNISQRKAMETVSDARRATFKYCLELSQKAEKALKHGVALLTKQGAPISKEKLESVGKAPKTVTKAKTRDDDSDSDSDSDSENDTPVSESPAVHTYAVLQFLASDAGNKLLQEAHIVAKLRAIMAKIDAAEIAAPKATPKAAQAAVL